MAAKQIHLSYAPSDRVAGSRFVDALRGAGAIVRVDGEEQDLPHENQDSLHAIVESDSYIVLLSKQGVNSPRLRALSLLYTTQLQDDPTKRILPVFLETLAPGEFWSFLAPFRAISATNATPAYVDQLIVLTAEELGLTLADPILRKTLPLRRRTQPRMIPAPAAQRNSFFVAVLIGGIFVCALGLFLLLARSQHPQARTALVSPPLTATVPATGINGTVTPIASTTMPVTRTPTTQSVMPTAMASPNASTPTPQQSPVDATPTAQPTEVPPTMVSTATPAPTATPQPLVDFPQGFSNASALQLNGYATIDGTAIRLTDGRDQEEASVYYNQRVPITQFTTQFQFQFTQAIADGITFVIQNDGPYALEPDGNNLAYGGMPNSIAIKYDLWDPVANVEIDNTGLYTNGAAPTQPDTPLPPTIDLHGGHPMLVQMTYRNAMLTVTITDTVTNATAQQTYAIDIAATIGAGDAYVGFTGSTGGLAAIQDIQNWVMTS